MKRIMLIAACAAAFVSAGAVMEKLGTLTNTLSMVSAKSTTMTTKELTQYARDTAEMMSLLTAMYERDVKTASGRVKWHGQLKQQIINTNELVKVTVYADGTQFTDDWKLITPASSVANFHSRVSTNGVPAALAAARLRRQQELAKGTNEVTVVVEANPAKKD